MSKKPNMTVTARHQADGSRCLAKKSVRSPYPNPPPNREAIGRLHFRGPSPKEDSSPAELAQKISIAALPDALILLDTNILTKELHPILWQAFRTKTILITSSVFSELLPWLKSPFHNKSIRNEVVAELRKAESPESSPARPSGTIEVLLSDQNAAYLSLGYEYYHNLLVLRKLFGPLSFRVLSKQLGREPTENEFSGFVQRQFGPRGLLLAKKGLKSWKSQNMVTDENLVIIAALTAIMRGSEVFIVTRDPDVLEQYFKLLCLMKEHYRAMRVAEMYAANPSSLPFASTEVSNDGIQVPEFTDKFVMRLETTDDQFDPLPRKFHFVNVYCILLGGDGTSFKVTWCNFCAETEMAEMLKIKTLAGGLNTDKFDGRNCTIRTEPFTATNHRVIVSIGTEPSLDFGPLGKFYHSDIINTLHENELHTTVSYDARF